MKIFRMMRSHPIEGVRNLLRLFVTKLRTWSVLILCRSFKPTVDFAYLLETLCFESQEEMIKFFGSIGAVCDAQKGKLMLKESKQAVSESKLLQGGFS